MICNFRDSQNSRRTSTDDSHLRCALQPAAHPARFSQVGRKNDRPRPIRGRGLPCLALVLGLPGLLELGGCENHGAPGVESLPSRPALASALGVVRPGGGRLAGIGWAPRPLSGAETSQRRALGSLAHGLSRRVLTSAGKKTAAWYGERSLVALAAGRPGDAVTLLAAAAELEPRLGWPLSDLAAVHLDLARADTEAYELVLGLIAAERALRREPGLATALFNQAVVLERLNLRSAAAEAWEAFLPRERDPLWAAEAREHLTALTRKSEEPNWPNVHESLERAAAEGDARTVQAALQRWPQQIRELAEEDVLAAWANALRPGPAVNVQAASHWLTISRQLGAALAKGQGEHLVEDAVSTIDRVSSLPTAAVVTARLSAGHRSYGAALALLREDDPGAARHAFSSARELLARADDPFALWADFYIGLCAFRQSQFQPALPLLEAVLAQPRAHRYPALRGRTLWLIGLIRAIQGELTASVSALREALALFGGLREVDNKARLEALITDDLDQLGDAEEAWNMAGSALRDATACHSPLAAYLAYEGIAVMAQGLGEPVVARRFQDEVVRSARLTGKAAVVAEALRGRARILAVGGRLDSARADLEEALMQLAAVKDRRSRAAVKGDLLLVAGSLDRQRDPARAVASLSRALSFFRAAGDHLQLSWALAERQLAYLAMGERRRAGDDLRGALAEIERQRERIAGTESRILFLDQKKMIFDRMVSFQLQQNQRPDLAFDYSERARARALLDWIVTSPETARLPAGCATPPLTAAMVQRRLPAGTAMLVLAEGGPRLLAWVVRRGDLHLVPSSTTVMIVSALTRRLESALRDNREAEFLSCSSGLYELLIRPASAYLSAGDSLVVVAEGPLAALPFALLRDVRTGRYLVEDHSLSMAPSATFFVDSLARDRKLRAKPGEGALFIGDPAFERELSPELPRLPAAAQEARDLAASCPGAAVLTGHQATRSAFLRTAGDHTIVHFGGHSVINPSFPLFSKLLLAPSPDDLAKGVLFTGQILGRRLGATRLVVLAACETARGRVSRTEGAESLARPFLAAGVPAVVASLSQVGDKEAALFFSRFYRHLREGLSAAAALRAAQLDFIASDKTSACGPSCWGAFELLGSAEAPLPCSLEGAHAR